jgi:hypothetical protein
MFFIIFSFLKDEYLSVFLGIAKKGKRVQGIYGLSNHACFSPMPLC